VKSLLLQLASRDDLPASLREPVQQTLQQITGQQLLLSADRGQTFAYMTFLLPVLQGTNGQTASVHVQSRRNRKGVIDAENCRLLFDLRMDTIGNTLVDVQIMNRWISIVVHNNHSAIHSFLELYRHEMDEGFERAGYRLVSLTGRPFPEPALAQEGRNAGSPAAAGEVSANLTDLYRPKPYKGVDVRI